MRNAVFALFLCFATSALCQPGSPAVVTLRTAAQRPSARTGPVASFHARIEYIPTQWPRCRIEAIPTQWPKFKLKAIEDGSEPGLRTEGSSATQAVVNRAYAH